MMVVIGVTHWKLIFRAILESLKHRNIVQLVQKIRDRQNERIYIVMEVSFLDIHRVVVAIVKVKSS